MVRIYFRQSYATDTNEPLLIAKLSLISWRKSYNRVAPLAECLVPGTGHLIAGDMLKTTRQFAHSGLPVPLLHDHRCWAQAGLDGKLLMETKVPKRVLQLPRTAWLAARKPAPAAKPVARLVQCRQF